MHIVLNKVKTKYRSPSTHNACIAFLKDFREGNLGRLTIDSIPENELERRKIVLEEIKKKEEELKKDKV